MIILPMKGNRLGYYRKKAVRDAFHLRAGH